jgi:hypothetical protein
MSKSAVGLLTLSLYATALVVVPLVMPAKAETSHSKHFKKHKKRFYQGPGVIDPRSAGEARPANRGWPQNQASRGTRPSAQAWPANKPYNCHGRSFDCPTWPPPFDEDPDRKASGADQ